MTLPDPPPSYFEGDPPQSQIAPGDTGRELLHEVRNLAAAVALLQRAVERFESQRRRLVATTLLAVMALTAGLLYTRIASVNQLRDRINASRITCAQDTARGDVEIEILSASLAANASNPQAQAFFGPRIAKLKALQRDCDKTIPEPGEPGWPHYFPW